MYLRPVSAYNIWKKSEFYDRKYFKEGFICPRDFDKINSMKQDNRNFIEKYN